MKGKLLIQPLAQPDYYALRDAIPLAIGYLDESRRTPALHGKPIRPKGPLQRRLERLDSDGLAAEWIR